MPWKITFDPAKREWTLRVRGLDFLDADKVFDGLKLEFADDRHDYGELRIQTVGYLNRRMIVVLWTQRGDARHVFSMRKANDREEEKYGNQIEARRK